MSILIAIKPRDCSIVRGCVQDGEAALADEILPHGPPTVKVWRAFVTDGFLSARVMIELRPEGCREIVVPSSAE